MTDQNTINRPDTRLLKKAADQATLRMGLTESELSLVLRRLDGSLGCKAEADGSQGERNEVHLIRIYEGLLKLVGDDPENIRHWLTTANQQFNEVPLKVMETEAGILDVLRYIDAMSNK